MTCEFRLWPPNGGMNVDHPLELSRILVERRIGKLRNRIVQWNVNQYRLGQFPAEFLI